MTNAQFFILLATIWVAPHADKTFARFVGLGMALGVFVAEWLA